MLVVNQDDTFDMLIDQETVSSGSLLDRFDLPVVPPKEINDDESDEMPQDWDDREKISDETTTKLDDWDEEVTMPEDWLVDEPGMVADHEATMPEGWDADGNVDLEAPLIVFPQTTLKCNEVGCGPWSHPEVGCG
eukprot:394423_1